MGCCGSASRGRKYELTMGDGTKRVFLTETESRVALASSGQDGTIRVIP